MSEPRADARELVEWAERDMTLTPGSTTALRGPAAAEYSVALLAEAEADIAAGRTFGEDEIRAEFGVPRRGPRAGEGRELTSDEPPCPGPAETT